jgi:hypothetical protein
MALTEQEELQKLIDEAVKAQLADNPLLKKEEPAQKYKLNLDGKTYEFNSQEEVDSAVATLALTARQQIDAAQKALAEKEGKGGYVTGKEQEDQLKFNQEEYIRLMHDDIPKATKYALDNVFGMPNAVETIKESLKESAALKSTVAVYQFRDRHPEVNVTDTKTTEILEGIRRELNQPFTLQGIEAAYGVAQARGLLESPQLTAFKKQQEEATRASEGGDPASNPFGTAGFPQRPNPNAGKTLGFQAPPSSGRSNTGFGANYERQIEDLPLAEIEKILRQAGQHIPN